MVIVTQTVVFDYAAIHVSQPSTARSCETITHQFDTTDILGA